MKVFITDTGETKTLKLVEIGETKNIAKDFIKEHACKIFGKKKVKESSSIEAFDNEGITSDRFDEWHDILQVAQSTLLARHDYLSNQDNELHPLIEMELASSYEKHLCTKKCFGIQYHNRDKKFALKNAMDAELSIFDRLAYGVITIKDPIGNSQDGNTSHTLNIKHFRHKSGDAGDEWLMQIFCDFIMTMPNPKDSFEFTAGVEFEFHKAHGGEIEYVEDEDWIFPFSMSFEQEGAVLSALHGAAQRNFVRIGVI